MLRLSLSPERLAQVARKADNANYSNMALQREKHTDMQAGTLCDSSRERVNAL